MDQKKAKRLKSAFLSGFKIGISRMIRKFDEEINDWTKAINKRPEKPWAYFNNRGTAYAQKANFYKAVSGWINSTEMESKTRASFKGYGFDYDRAIADYTEAIRLTEIESERSIFYKNRGKVYVDRGEYDKGISDYSEAIRLCPNSGLFDRGIAYDLTGEYDKAIADYTELIRLSSPGYEQYDYFYNRGIVYDEKGECEKAIADYTTAIGLSGRMPFTDALHNRCFAYKAMGRHDKAKSDLAKLKFSIPDCGEIVYRRSKKETAPTTCLH
jgi:tetratricopeptide (TPR) repeat protein